MIDELEMIDEFKNELKRNLDLSHPYFIKATMENLINMWVKLSINEKKQLREKQYVIDQIDETEVSRSALYGEYISSLFDEAINFRKNFTLEILNEYHEKIVQLTKALNFKGNL